jgi:hypothetical protein
MNKTTVFPNIMNKVIEQSKSTERAPIISTVASMFA